MASLARPPPRTCITCAPLMLVAQSTVHPCFFQFIDRSDDGTRRTERTQVRKIQLHIVRHLVIGTPIQILRRRPIANVRCCAERFHPKGFRHAQWWSIARSALASTPIVHSATPLDPWCCGTGVQLGPLRSQMSCMLPIDNSFALSIMISRTLFSGSFSAATLNALSTLTSDLRGSGLVVYSDLRLARRYPS